MTRKEQELDMKLEALTASLLELRAEQENDVQHLCDMHNSNVDAILDLTEKLKLLADALTQHIRHTGN